MERIIAYAPHAIRNHNARQTATRGERKIAYARHRFSVIFSGNHDIRIGASTDTRYPVSTVAVQAKIQAFTVSRHVRRNHTILGNRTICAGNRVVACVVVPRTTESNRLPLRRCAVKLNTRQTVAIVERPIAYARHAIRNHNARQTAARVERTNAYNRHRFAIVGRRNDDIRISTSTDIRYRVSTVFVQNKCQAFVVSRHVRRNHAILGNRTICTGNRVVACVVVPRTTESNRLPLRRCAVKLNTRQTAAISERTIAYAPHAVRNHNARQFGAIIECPAANGLYAIRNGIHACFSIRITNQFCFCFVKQHTINGTVVLIIAVYRNTRQTFAKIKRIVTYTSHTIRNRNTRQILAIVKRIIKNGIHSFSVICRRNHDIGIRASTDSRNPVSHTIKAVYKTLRTLGRLRNLRRLGALRLLGSLRILISHIAVKNSERNDSAYNPEANTQ